MQLLHSIPIYLVPRNLPNVLQNENTATIVLNAVKNMMTIDDPAIVIQWNAPGFNDVPATPGSRNGVAKTQYLYLEPTMTSDSARIISPDGIRKILFHHLRPLHQSSHTFLFLSFK